MLDNIVQWLDETALAETVRSGDVIFPWLESVHVLAVALVLGSIAVVDLRLLGLGSVNRPVTTLVRQVLPITWLAFAVAVVTGAAMFISNAVEYAKNLPFQLKLLLLALAGINMLAFHFVTYRDVSHWSEARRPPLAARIAGAFSISLWMAIVTLGRWIGFV